MKYLFFLLFSLCLTLDSQAQRPFTLGPKLGLHFNTLETIGGNFNIDQQSITSGAAGFFARINVGRIYIQPEAYWTTKGSNFIFKDPNTEEELVDGEVRLSTFEVPVLAGIYLVKTNNDFFNLRVLAGPVFTSVINEKSNDFELLNSGNYKFYKSDLGIQVGGGMDLGNLSFDFRYESGLSDFSDTFKQRSKIYVVSVAFKML